MEARGGAVKGSDIAPSLQRTVKIHRDSRGLCVTSPNPCLLKPPAHPGRHFMSISAASRSIGMVVPAYIPVQAPAPVHLQNF